MDNNDKDDIIKMTQNHDNSNENTENSNEAINSENTNSGEITDDKSETQKTYDDFMYEPIGFEELEKQQKAIAEATAIRKEKRMHTRNERVIIALLSLIFIVTVVLSVVGIIKDISVSENALKNTSASKNVVLYREPKPNNSSNDESLYVDQNGKFTTEGVAAKVRPSVVEIYTYSDVLHSELIGTGSGVVISDDGYIVTNAHVLQADGYHTIIDYENNTYDAKIIGRDSKTDIAIIKVNNADLTPAVLGDSDEVVVGEQVMAIGNPAGLSGSVTDGIVSAINRRIKAGTTSFEMNCIQTNADISPGNSGGALINMYGQVIGITSSKYVSSSYEGLGFAITINDAAPIIEQLINQGHVSGRFRIGIELIDMNNEYKVAKIEEELGIELPDGFKGIYIAVISEECDISNTALQVGDFITKINGTPISSYDELYNTLSSQYGVGDLVPAECAHIDADGNIEYYKIEFKLMEDTSGDF